MKKRYSVAMVFTKRDDKLNIQLGQLTNIDADTPEQAFGIAYDMQSPNLPDHTLFLKVVTEQLDAPQPETCDHEWQDFIAYKQCVKCGEGRQ